MVDDIPSSTAKTIIVDTITSGTRTGITKREMISITKIDDALA